MRRLSWRAGLSAALCAGCGGSATAPPVDQPPAAVARIEVSPARELFTGFRHRRRFTATARDAADRTVPGKSFTWSSSNLAVATVDTGGWVTPVWEGQTTITASADGVTGAALVTVALPLIAFASERTGDWDIYVVARDGSGLRNLTNNPALDEEPTWSPDGSRIAFRSTRNGHGDIYVMRPDGSGIVNVSNMATDVSPAVAWSPDGTRLAFVSRDAPGVSEINLVGADGTGRTPLTQCGCPNDSPAWSPDGSRIAFQSIRDTARYTDIFSLSVDGTGLLNLTQHPSADMLPSWSPDGSRILFTTGREGTWRLYTMLSSGADPRRLVQVESGTAAWSPDGQWVAFAGSTPAYGPALSIVHPDGTGKRDLVTDFWLSYFSWSPDSQELAYSFSYYTMDIGVQNINIGVVGLSGTSDLLVQDPAHDVTPRFRPRVP